MTTWWSDGFVLLDLGGTVESSKVNRFSHLESSWLWSFVDVFQETLYFHL